MGWRKIKLRWDEKIREMIFKFKIELIEEVEWGLLVG